MGTRSRDIRDFKIRRLRTTDYGWTHVFLSMEPGPSTQQVTRKNDVKIADYRQRTTNKGRSKLKRNLVKLALFLYFVYKVCLLVRFKMRWFTL